MDPRTNQRSLVGLVIWLVVVVFLSTPIEATVGSCTDLLFRETFESGGTSGWSGSTDQAKVTGTWTFSLDFSGSLRSFALELVERPNGALVGYLVGGTSERVLVAGSVSGTSVSLELEFKSPAGVRSIVVAGTLMDSSIVGTASGDLDTQATVLSRTPCELFEYQLAAAVDTGASEPQHLRLLSAVVDGDGSFVGGGFVGDDDCALWACDGGLTSFSEVGDVLTVGLETDGGCSAGSSFTVAREPSGLYVGSYSFTDCAGTTSGDLLAAFSMGTTSYEAAEVLANRVSIGNALVAGVPLTSVLTGLSSTYLNFGKDEPAIRSDINSEIARYATIEVDLERVRELYTRAHPHALPDLLAPFSLKVEERRTGFSSRGGPPVVYLDTGSRPIIDEFALIADGADGWQIVGNQVEALDLPFASTLPLGGTRLEAPTAAGSPVYVSIGPYGGHFGPLTGDPSGEAKANFVGFLAEDDSDMEELEGDGDGVREPGEVWGFPIGGDLTGDSIRLRRPPFIAPADGSVFAIDYEEGASPIHFDHEPQWKVHLGLPGGVRYAMGHVGKIAPALRGLVLATTGVDPDTFSGPVGTDLLAGYDPIPVAAGTELALPQILAGPVAGHPGYWVGEGGFLEWPWAQIEFQVPFSLGAAGGGDFCVYRFFSESRRDELRAMMTADMLDPDSQRYRDRLFYDRWHWTAEGSLCLSESLLPRDFSDLYTRLGGWTERSEPGTSVDELFSFVPIATTSGVYDATNYDSAAVTHLVLRNKQPGPYSWSMPDGSTAQPFLPVGEVLERSDEALLIKWRDLSPSFPVVYQRVAYRLDSEGLTIEWGNFATTTVGAIAPILLPGDPCDDSTVLCYDHSLGAWPP